MLHPRPFHKFTTADGNLSHFPKQPKMTRHAPELCVKFLTVLTCALTSNDEIAVNLTSNRRQLSELDSCFRRNCGFAYFYAGSSAKRICGLQRIEEWQRFPWVGEQQPGVRYAVLVKAPAYRRLTNQALLR